MNIFDYLDQMYEDVKSEDWDAIEAKYKELAKKLSKGKTAQKIAKINLTKFRETLAKKLSEAVETAENISAAAVYFKYDIDNDWQSCFFICPDYHPESEEDDDWACEWEEEVEGPKLPNFSKIYHKYSGDGDDASGNGITLYLIARTVCTFGRCVEDIPPTPVAICIGFHDQDPIWRILDKKEEE